MACFYVWFVVLAHCDTFIRMMKRTHLTSDEEKMCLAAETSKGTSHIFWIARTLQNLRALKALF